MSRPVYFVGGSRNGTKALWQAAPMIAELPSIDRASPVIRPWVVLFLLIIAAIIAGVLWACGVIHPF